MVKLILEGGKGQARRRFLDTGKIDKEKFDIIFNFLRKLDNANGTQIASKYGDWIVWRVIENGYEDKTDIETFVDMIHPLLIEFDKLKNNHVISGKEADIFSYNDKQLEEFIEQSNYKTKEEIIEDGTEVLKRGKDYTVYKVNTFEASRVLGRGTKWCISGSKIGEWQYHDDHFYIYFVIRDKDKRKGNEWDKVAVLVYKTNPRYWAITTAIDWEYFDFKYLREHYPDLSPSVFGIPNPDGREIALHYFRNWVRGDVNKCGDGWCVDGDFYVDVPQFLRDYVNQYVGVETMLRRYGIDIENVQGVQRTLAFPIRRVTGDFVYKDGNLEAARNLPEYVGGDFDISGNRISDVSDLLNNFPEYVGGDVILTGNPVTKKITEKDLREVSEIKGGIYL